MISLEDALKYDPETGSLTWKVSRKRARAGLPAGCINTHGYWQVRLCGKGYRSHRVAWFLTHGKWPDGEVDHIDGNKLNNALFNLRVVSRSVNGQNQRRAMCRNKLGVLGVSPSRGKFRATISVNGTTVALGRFATLEEANAAYLAAKRQFHEGCTL